jgi:hypothetical protein
MLQGAAGVDSIAATLAKPPSHPARGRDIGLGCATA